MGTFYYVEKVKKKKNGVSICLKQYFFFLFCFGCFHRSNLVAEPTAYSINKGQNLRLGCLNSFT